MVLTIIAIFLIQKRYSFTIVNIPKYNHTPKSTTVSIPNSKFNIPNSLLLPVPFTPQAPTGNWDIMHNEDCEEASVIMSAAYFSALPSPISGEGQGERLIKLPVDYVEQELQKLTDWEQNTFGYNLDIDSLETTKMIEANYSLKTKIINNFSLDDIKKELSLNHLIIFPINGQMLNNPNFKAPGPKYHMIVIRGYDEKEIITNDPGTRNGMNYSYSFETLYNANGNWNHETKQVNRDNKNIIVVWK